MRIACRHLFATTGFLVLATLGNAQSARITGIWDVKFNGVPGSMEIAGSSGNYQGRVNLGGGWETLYDVNVVGYNVSFRRTAGDQRYTGTVRGAQMNGTFTQFGSGAYPWSGTQTNTLGDEPMGDPTPPPQRQQRGFSSQGGASVAGSWQVSFNGVSGSMEITGGGGSYSARLNVGGGWEQLTEVTVSGGSISFRRGAGDQRYQGSISGTSMRGTFSQYGSGAYQWSAQLTNAYAEQAPSAPYTPPAAQAPPVTQAPAAAPQRNRPQQGVPNLDGTWRVNFNGVVGTLEISGANARVNLGSGWESLSELTAYNGRVFFRRESGDQRYMGNYGDGSMSGSFTQSNQGSYPWSAQLGGSGTPSLGGSAQAPAPRAPAQPQYAQPPSQPAASSAVFDSWNKAITENGPTRLPRFTVGQPTYISMIMNYHWNDGRGAPAGTITIISTDGRIVGAWPAEGTGGTGGARNVNWRVSPNITLPPGSYFIVDSDPATWSHNVQSGGIGFSVIR